MTLILMGNAIQKLLRITRSKLQRLFEKTLWSTFVAKDLQFAVTGVTYSGDGVDLFYKEFICQSSISNSN